MSTRPMKLAASQAAGSVSLGVDCASGPIVTVVSATEDALTETGASLSNERRRVNSRSAGLPPGIPGAVRREVEPAQLLATYAIVPGFAGSAACLTRAPSARRRRLTNSHTVTNDCVNQELRDRPRGPREAADTACQGTATQGAVGARGQL